MASEYLDKNTNLLDNPSLRSLSVTVSAGPFAQLYIPIRSSDSESPKFQRLISDLWAFAFDRGQTQWRKRDRSYSRRRKIHESAPMDCECCCVSHFSKIEMMIPSAQDPTRELRMDDRRNFFFNYVFSKFGDDEACSNFCLVTSLNSLGILVYQHQSETIAIFLGPLVYNVFLGWWFKVRHRREF